MFLLMLVSPLSQLLAGVVGEDNMMSALSEIKLHKCFHSSLGEADG